MFKEGAQRAHKVTMAQYLRPDSMKIPPAFDLA